MSIFKKFRKTGYIFRAARLCVCAAIVCAFVPACGEEKESEKLTLTITTDADTEPRLEYVVNAFNEQNEDYEIKIETYADKGVKKYYLRRGKTQADLVTFVNYSDANSFTEILQPLNLLTATGRYQSSMINNMRFSDDNIYSLPSPGFLYSLCYNTDAFDTLGISEPPTTYVDANRLSQEKHKEGYAFCASSSTDEGLVNTFMAISTPVFVTTTKGVAFLKNYYEGKETLADGSATSEWKTVLQSYKDLYTNSYFSVSSDGASDFINGNSYAFYYTHDGSLASTSESVEESGGTVPDYKFYPFVSSQSNRTSIITNPYYYIAVTRSAYADDEKKAGINAFLNFYTSSEGQYAAQTLKDGTKIEGSISFISDYEYQNEQFTGKYEPLKETFESGRVLFADYFSCVFEGTGAILREYLNGTISLDELLVELDEAVAENVSGEEDEYIVNDTFEYSEKDVKSGETAIGNFVADAARISDVSGKIYAAFVPSSCVNADLLEGTVTASELETVFSEVALTRLYIKGSLLKRIVSDNVALLGAQTSGNGEFMLMSGVSVEKGTVTILGIQPQDETKYPVILPQSLIDKYEITTDSSLKISLIDCIKDYLKNYSPTATTDGRYGTTE